MAPPSLRIHVLGCFGVTVVRDVAVPDGAWPRRKPAALLKLLALAPGHLLHREQPMGALWPDHDPGAVAANLRKARQLRTALEGGGKGAGEYWAERSTRLASLVTA